MVVAANIALGADLPARGEPAVSLDLPGSPEQPRRLQIRLQTLLGQRLLSVGLWAHDARRSMLVFAEAPFRQCRLYVGFEPCLWLRNTGYTLADDEAQILRAALEPRGIRVQFVLGEVSLCTD